MTQKRDKLISDIFNTLELTKRAMFAHFYHATAKGDLGPSQIHILFIVGRDQPVQLKDLAAKLHLTPGAITQIIDSLVKDGYLKRTPHDTDRRIIQVQLTKKGVNHIHILMQKRLEWFTEVVSSLDTEELVTYLKVQQKILTKLESTNNTRENHQ